MWAFSVLLGMARAQAPAIEANGQSILLKLPSDGSAGIRSGSKLAWQSQASIQIFLPLSRFLIFTFVRRGAQLRDG